MCTQQSAGSKPQFYCDDTETGTTIKTPNGNVKEHTIIEKKGSVVTANGHSDNASSERREEVDIDDVEIEGRADNRL